MFKFFCVSFQRFFGGKKNSEFRNFLLTDMRNWQEHEPFQCRTH